jgi:hypothetical protein
MTGSRSAADPGPSRHRDCCYQWQADLAAAVSHGADVRISRLVEGLTEDALAAEREMIASLPPLKNKLPSGEGGRRGPLPPPLLAT